MTLSELFQSDEDVVLRSLDSALCRQSQMAAYVLMHIAVIDARNLYLRAGFESMKSFCMAKMQLTEDAAYKRIQVARLAKQMPRLFVAIANGELSLYDVRLLASRLTPSNVETLVTECANRSTSEIERVLVRLFPQAEALPLAVVEQNPVADRQPGLAELLPPISNTPTRVRTKIEPQSAEHCTLHVSLPMRASDKLRYLQSLLAHTVPNGNVPEVIERSFDVHIEKLEREKFGIGARAGRKHSKPTVRSIPAQIKKAVYDRDGGQCAYVDPDGRRCTNTAPLEFDHIVPVAKGGKSTIENLRLLCRAHNQYAADQAFGQRFMDEKRASGAARAAWRRGSAPVRSRPSGGC